MRHRNGKEINSDLANLQKRRDDLFFEIQEQESTLKQLENAFVEGQATSHEVHEARIRVSSSKALLGSLDERKETLEKELRQANAVVNRAEIIKAIAKLARTAKSSFDGYYAAHSELDRLIADHSARLFHQKLSFNTSKRQGLDFLGHLLPDHDLTRFPSETDEDFSSILKELAALEINADDLRLLLTCSIKGVSSEYSLEIADCESRHQAKVEKQANAERQKELAESRQQRNAEREHAATNRTRLENEAEKRHQEDLARSIARNQELRSVNKNFVS